MCADHRQRVALELLESERVYVSHLSLLLKANISFNGSEAFASKDKRWVLKIHKNSEDTEGEYFRISHGDNWLENTFGVIATVCEKGPILTMFTFQMVHAIWFKKDLLYDFINCVKLASITEQAFLTHSLTHSHPHKHTDQHPGYMPGVVTDLI